MRGDLLRGLEVAASTLVQGDARRAEGVVADVSRQAGRDAAALDGVKRAALGQRRAGELAGRPATKG